MRKYNPQISRIWHGEKINDGVGSKLDIEQKSVKILVPWSRFGNFLARSRSIKIIHPFAYGDLVEQEKFVFHQRNFTDT